MYHIALLYLFPILAAYIKAFLIINLATKSAITQPLKIYTLFFLMAKSQHTVMHSVQ